MSRNKNNCMGELMYNSIFSQLNSIPSTVNKNILDLVFSNFPEEISAIAKEDID